MLLLLYRSFIDDHLLTVGMEFTKWPGGWLLYSVCNGIVGLTTLRRPTCW